MTVGLLATSDFLGKYGLIFAAVIVGAILSSFNSALNSTATLFSLGIYKKLINPQATQEQVIRSGKWCGWIVAVLAMSLAPLLAGEQSIFGYLQKMNGMYAVPIFAVVLIGMLNKRVPAIAAKAALVVGFGAIALGYFVYPFTEWVKQVHGYHFLGIVFGTLIVLMLAIGKVSPRAKAYEQQYSGDVDMTPWSLATPFGIGLVVIVLGIYGYFADFSILSP